MKAVTPAILYAMMEVSGVCLDGQDEETGMLLQTNNSGGFLQIGGFTVVYDATRPAGEGHVLSITLDGETQPLDREDDTRKIMLASNNYILGGGSDYTMLADLPKEAELGGELEAVQGYLEACIADGSIADYARPQGRIVMRGGYTPAEYTARIRILDGDSPAAAGTQVTYIADGGPQRTATDLSRSSSRTARTASALRAGTRTLTSTITSDSASWRTRSAPGRSFRSSALDDHDT